MHGYKWPINCTRTRMLGGSRTDTGVGELRQSAHQQGSLDILIQLISLDEHRLHLRLLGQVLRHQSLTIAV